MALQKGKVMKRLEEISIPIFILAIVILAAFVLVLRAQDTTMPVQTGTISLTAANLQSQVFTTNDLWLEVSGVSNATACLVIHIPWNETNGVYDLFGTTNLGANVPGLNVTNWVWLARTAAWQTNIAMANLWPDMSFFVLGTMLDSDGDGLTDAYEKLVSHTDPNSPLTIALIAPTDNAFYAEPATIPIKASVSGSIATNVEFFRGAIRIARVASVPYQYSWPIVAAGQYSLTAVAHDFRGLSFTSAPVSITITNLCGY